MIREGRLLKSLHQSPERYFSVADPDLQTGGGGGGGLQTGVAGGVGGLQTRGAVIQTLR